MAERAPASGEPPDPMVETLLAIRPSTAAEWARVGWALAGLHRPDLARQYFQKTLAARPDTKQLADLADTLGVETLLEIGSRSDLAPEGRRLAEAALEARAKQLQDSGRLASLIEQLKAPSPEVRNQALAGLQQAGLAAVGPLVEALQDPQWAEHGEALRAGLAALGPDGQGPLTAMLDAPDSRLAVAAADVLGSMPTSLTGMFLLRPACQTDANPQLRASAQAALIRVWGHVPHPQEAAHKLAELSQRFTQRTEPLGEEAPGHVLLWEWNAQANQPVSRRVGPDDAYRWYAARFARDAHVLVPQNRSILLLHLAAMLEQAAYENGLDRPLSVEGHLPAAQAMAFGPEVMDDLLAHAMRTGQNGAAAAAASILGRIPSAERLLYRSATPCALVSALRHADLRVRFAAAEALVRIRPLQSFAGSSYLPEALAFLAASTGSQRVLIGGPNPEESMRLCRDLARLGYETDVASTGRQLVRKALQSPDYELVLLDAALSDPTVDFVLQSLRRDGRTGMLPVGVLARADQLERARHLVRNDRWAEAFSRPHTEHAVRWQVERLRAKLPDRPSAAERKRRAAIALDWLAELAKPEARALYDLTRAEGAVLGAVAVPGLSEKALAVLGELGTAESQRALVEMASRNTAPFATRGAALGAFRSAVERYGILLTTTQIRVQYDRYNRSARDDPASQAVLGLILDCIEAPTRAPGLPQRHQPQSATGLMRSGPVGGP